MKATCTPTPTPNHLLLHNKDTLNKYISPITSPVLVSCIIDNKKKNMFFMTKAIEQSGPVSLKLFTGKKCKLSQIVRKGSNLCHKFDALLTIWDKFIIIRYSMLRIIEHLLYIFELCFIIKAILALLLNSWILDCTNSYVFLPTAPRLQFPPALGLGRAQALMTQVMAQAALTIPMLMMAEVVWRDVAGIIK